VVSVVVIVVVDTFVIAHNKQCLKDHIGRSEIFLAETIPLL
jgi:hypothetical protein